MKLKQRLSARGSLGRLEQRSKIARNVAERRLRRTSLLCHVTAYIAYRRIFEKGPGR